MPAKPRQRKRPSHNQPVASSAAKSLLTRLESRLAGRQVLVVILIVGLSMLLRVGYFLELNSGPCIRQHRWDQSDMSFFHHWAGRIASGDWLCETVDPPVHDWHRRIAQLHFHHHPSELATIKAKHSGPGGEIDAAQELWNKWAGGKRFYQGPAYPYLMALVYRVCADVRAVFLLQMLAGVATNVLVYLIARRVFGEVIGVASALMVCLCSPILHHELVLLRESLVVFATMVMIYLADIASCRKRFGWWLAGGIFVGASLLLKAHFALFAMGAGLLLAFQLRANRTALIRCMSGFVLGLAIGVSPLAVRNTAVGVPAFATATSSKPAFALWNGYEPGAGVSWRLSAAAEVMGKTAGEGSVVWETLRTHPEPSSFVGLLAAKLARALHWHELSDSANFYYYRLHSRFLRFMPVTFFALGPLGIVGMVLAYRQASKCKFLYLQVFSNFAVLVLFFPVGRFRLPLLAAIAPFAALTLVVLIKSIEEKTYRKAAAVVAGVVLVGLWTGRPPAEDQPLLRTADFSVPVRVYYEPMIKQAAVKEDWSGAAEIANELIHYRPGWLDEIGPSCHPGSDHEASLTKWFAQLYRWCGSINAKAGNEIQARRLLRRSEELSVSLKPGIAAGQ